MKNLNADNLYRAMEGIGDDLLLRSEEEGAAVKTKSAGARTIRRMSVAVCTLAALALLGFFGIHTLRVGKDGASLSSAPAAAGPAQEAGAATDGRENTSLTLQQAAKGAAQKPVAYDEAAAEEAAPEAEAVRAEEETDAMMQAQADAGMQAFFVYEGRRYVEEERIPDDGTVRGDYVTTIKYMPDEWTDEEAYTDNAGSVTGDVYRINGKEPREALCMVEEEGGTLLLFYAADR